MKTIKPTIYFVLIGLIVVLANLSPDEVFLTGCIFASAIVIILYLMFKDKDLKNIYNSLEE